MANEIKNCPMCGTKLKMKDGRMTCKKCGYYLRNQNEQADYQSAPQYGGAGNTATQPNNPYHAGSAPGSGGTQQYGGGYRTAPGQQSAPNRQASSQYQAVPTQVPVQKKGSGVHPAMIIAPIVILTALAGVFFVLVKFAVNLDSQDPSDSQLASSTEESRRLEDGSKRLEDGTVPEVDNRRLPRSDFFRSIAEYIWDKDYRNITAEEYASLSAIEINKEEKTIEFYLAGDEEAQSVSYRSDYGMDLADLASFPGLQWISVDDDLEKGDLDGLEQLYGIHTENNLEEYLDIIPHPEYITDLTIVDSFLARNLSGLESFPALEYLYVEYGYLEDISALSQFTGLTELSLSDCSRVTDFTPLMSLTGLASLNINSSSLKSIDFIKNMPLLNNLSVEADQLANLDALKECPDLTYLYLYLDDNYNLHDYSVVGELENLSELVLEMSWGWHPDLVMPSFEKLTKLQYLSLKNARDLSPLEDATGLTYLALENCSGGGLESIASLQALEALVINDFSNYTESLEPLTRIPGLTLLSLEDTSIFGNIEEIFGIPTLQHLYLDDCQVGMDFDKIPDNSSLLTLSLNGITILEDPTYNNGGEVSLSGHDDIFDHFPNLTSLYVASLGLNNIDFVEKLPYLQYLDITDNNVTSLKPLESLSDFQVVWCGKNTILESVSEESDIWVIVED